MKSQLNQLLSVVIVGVSLTLAQFKVQLIGNLVDDHELSKRDFCTTKECLLDSEILFIAASQNETVSPCDDFKEFTLGDFIKHSALNERYQFKGLQNDLDEIYKEKFRKVLTSKIQTNGSRTFSMIKNYFSKCVNSKHVVQKGTSGVIDHLKKLGGSPFLNRDTENWDSKKFSLNKLFELEANDAMSIFLDHKLDRCKSPKNASKEILCFKSDFSWVNTKSSRVDMFDLLLELTNSYESYLIGETKRNVLRANISSAISLMSNFISLKEKYERSKKVDAPQLITIKQLSNFLPALHLNWTNIINNQLLKSSKITEDDEIMIERPELIKDLSEVVAKCDNETLSEAFTLSFLYIHQWVYKVYPFDEHRAANRGTSKAFQRWETCLKEITYRMRPASEVLFGQHQFNSTVQSAVEKLVQEAIRTCVSVIKSKSNLSPEVADALTSKLEKIHVIAGVSEKDLSFETLEKFYEELDLSGNEGYVITWIRILRFHQKIRMEEKKKWRRVLDVFLHNVYIKYDVIENVLYIPGEWILYPWFHVSRPHFFNVATLFVDVLESVNVALRDFLTMNKKLTSFTLGLENVEEISYEYYSNWLSQNRELQLGANRMTNQQLFWMALARKFFVKYQPNIPKNFDPIGQLQNDFLHILYKRQKGFQEAFGCNMSANDFRMETEYQQAYINLLN